MLCMRERVVEFLVVSNKGVPAGMYVGLLLVFGLGSLLLLTFSGIKNGWKWSARLLLLEFIFLLISLTVLYRPIQLGRAFNLIPFWSYRAVLGWEHDLLLTQIIMNVVAFIPLGFLLGCSFSKMKWWKVALFSAFFSLIIETIQFITIRGFAEFDDVFHNVVGAMIGYGMFVGLRWLIKRVRRERVVGA